MDKKYPQAWTKCWTGKINLHKAKTYTIKIYNTLFLFFRLADMMTFGAIEPCTECNGELAAIVFRSGFGYQCMGNIR